MDNDHVLECEQEVRKQSYVSEMCWGKFYICLSDPSEPLWENNILHAVSINVKLTLPSQFSPAVAVCGRLL